MAEAGRSWYTELDFDSYVLDLLLLGWCTVCFLIILSVNALVAAFGPLQKQPQERSRGDAEGVSLTGAALPVETAKWFNDAVNWFYLHYYYTPQYADDWVRSLNEQLLRLGGPVQAKFERIQSGSLPPKITHVSCEASPTDRFIIHAKLETRDLSFVVFASQQTHEGVKLTNVTASVLRLKGTLRVESYREGGDVKVSFNFEGKPEIKVGVKPLNPYQEHSELVDLGVVEANVRNSIILAKTTFIVTHLLMPGDLTTVNLPNFGDKGGGPDQGRGSDQGRDRKLPDSNLQPRDVQNFPRQAPSPGGNTAYQTQAGLRKQQDLQQQAPRDTEIFTAAAAEFTSKTPPAQRVSVQKESLQTIPVQPYGQSQKKSPDQLQESVRKLPQKDQLRDQPQARVQPQTQLKGVFEPVETPHVHSSLYSAPAKPPRMVGDKRLLVKVIKANGLSVQEVGAANTVCMLSTDEPIQGYSTSAVKNTQNPFWDEHFLFDITHDTQEVRVEVYDRNKLEEKFVGEAVVYVEDLRKTPSSRQILRLRPETDNFEYNVGTVTAEFLFMDPSEADLLLDSMTTTANNQLSPRRRNELARYAQSGSPSPNYLDKSYGEESSRFSYPDTPYGVGRQQAVSATERPDDLTDPYPLNQAYTQQPAIVVKDSKKAGFGSSLLKRFGRKKRALSADRTTPNTREGDYLRPPEPVYGLQSKDDLELVRPQIKDEASPNLKKSRTLGGSLKKLFKRRSRKQSKSRGNSRESSLSRGSRSKDHSRDNSLTRQSQREYELRASSVS